MGLGSSSEAGHKQQPSAMSPQASPKTPRTRSTTTDKKRQAPMAISIPQPTPSPPRTKEKQSDSPLYMIVSPTDTISPMTPTSTHKKMNVERSEETAPVPTVFRWRHGGHNVQLAGSFNGWKERIPMQYSQEDFTCIQNLTPGVYHYKYIVDGEWKTDPGQPMASDDKGVVNNVIEVIAPRKEDRLSARPTAPYSPPGSYSQTLPWDISQPTEEDSMQSSPPSLPPHLQYALLNTEPAKDDPSILPLPHHVMLNHLYSLPRRDLNMLILGVTQRYSKSNDPDSQKFITTVFYKPLPDSTIVQS